jgi:hypothetical protein
VTGTPGAGGIGGAGGAGAGNGTDLAGGGGGGFTGGAGAGAPGGLVNSVDAQGGGVSGATFAGGYTAEAGGGRGGFGGGGQGGSFGGGGGGGYGGGGGGATGGGGGGGGSYVNASNDGASSLDVAKTAATRTGAGQVVVTELAPPAISVASPAAHPTSGRTPVDPFAGDSITDANIGAPTETLTVTPSATVNGVLSDPNAATDASAINAGVFSVTGTALQVTSALDGLVFTPSAGASGTTTTFTISDASSAYPVAVTDATTMVADAACYAEGTHVLTLRGEIAVEALCVGDGVVTASGAAPPIRWLGWRALDCALHPDPRKVWPVRVRAQAFGENQPRRDLWLSPGHNIASEGVLMPISALLNGQSVAQIEQDRVKYWHVELDAHDVIFAEGLPAESYLDTGNRTAFANGGAFVEAHPDFAPRHWAETCLPLVFEGPAVAAIKARLLARLAERGCGVTQEADAHVRVDGQRVEPIWLSKTKLCFVLPPGGCEILLRSSTFAPAHTVAASDDFRTLGLCVAALQIDGSPVALRRDEACAAGWHKAEYNGETFQHRWTTGATPLPAGARIVVVDLAGEGCYWRRPDESLAALSS